MSFKMQSTQSLLSILIVYVELALRISAHGRLLEPPSRSSMWRLGYNTPKNYLDNQMFCGGFANQWDVNGGKCGVCGDPWQGPRDHEAGGKYASGLVTRRYAVGAVISVVVQLTASHRGYFEFRLCPVPGPTTPATPDCFDKHLLPLADGTGSRYYVTLDGANNYGIQLKLPEGLECGQCVLQWKYNAGNSWGVDGSGRGCSGCGAQEQFYGCSDIGIGDKFPAPAPYPPPGQVPTERPPATGDRQTTTGSPDTQRSRLDASGNGWMSSMDSGTNIYQSILGETTKPPKESRFKQKIVVHPSVKQKNHGRQFIDSFQNSDDFFGPSYADYNLDDQAEMLNLLLSLFEEQDPASLTRKDVQTPLSTVSPNVLLGERFDADGSELLLDILDEGLPHLTDTDDAQGRFQSVTGGSQTNRRGSGINQRRPKTTSSPVGRWRAVEGAWRKAQRTSTEGVGRQTEDDAPTPTPSECPVPPCGTDNLDSHNTADPDGSGNSWGTTPGGKSCVGCGPQEQFYACADVTIGDAPGGSVTSADDVTLTSDNSTCVTTGVASHIKFGSTFMLLMCLPLIVL